MKVYLLLAFLFLITACHKKGVPAIVERNAPPPRKIESVYPPRETVAPDSIAGKSIFAGRCVRCHALPVVSQFTRERWDAKLPVMFPRAGLTNEEALHVRSWLLANAARL